jgi:hypothetical protein
VSLFISGALAPSFFLSPELHKLLPKDFDALACAKALSLHGTFKALLSTLLETVLEYGR